MAYQAARRMTLAGNEYRPGDLIDKEDMADFPVGRLDSLRRVGHIIEVPSGAKGRKRQKATKPEPAPEPEATVEEPSEDEPAEEPVEVTSDPEAST